MLVEKRVDGLIFAPSSNTENISQDYKQFNILIVLVDRDIEIMMQIIKGIVKLDNKNGTYESTKHLIKEGHTDILYLSGPLKTDIAKQRLNGYIRAHEKNDAKYKLENILEGQYKYEWAYKYIKILESINFSAICYAKHLMAIGAIHALKERNLKVPEEISVVGFDDILTSKLIDPPLTTIRQPACDMYKKASELLINHLENKEDKISDAVVLKPQLIIRNSTKNIKLQLEI